MALRITPGYKSLNLYFDQPTNAYNIDDVDTGGTTQAVQNDIRTDLQGLKVWISTTSWGNNTPTSGELYYDGPFQGYLVIDKISQASTNTLVDNTTYYIKYAFISKLQPSEFTYLPIVNNASGEQTGTTLDVALPLQGYLTRDPIEIPTDENGNNPVYTNATGEFKVYRYSQDISTTSDVTYAIKANSSTGGVAISFGTGNSKNIYTVSAITDLTGTITLQATYTDPLNNANTITIEQVLNVSKRRPGQTAPLVVLTATGQAFVLTEDSSGSSKSPANVKITATASNITNPTYTWTLDPNGTNTPIEGTGVGYTSGTLTGTTLNAGKDELTISNSFFTGATPQFKLFKVVVGSSVVGSTISVNDLMSIYYLKEGSDSLAMGLINENQTVTLDKTGVAISGLPIESEAQVVEGTTQLTAPAVTFAVNSQSGFGGTLTINTATNIPVNGKPAGYIRATQITANQAAATITATVAGTTLSKVLTVNRVQDGADGTNIDAQLTNDFHAVPTAADGTGAVYTGASTTIEVYKNGVLQTSGFTFYVSGLQNIKYRGTGDTSDRTGTGTTNGALTTISGTATVNIVELSSDSGYVDITARQTSDGQLFTERFSLSRNKAGIIGKDAVIYEIKPNAKAISKQSSDVGTDGIHTPGNLIFSVYKTVGNNTAALLTDQSLYYIQWNSPDAEPANTDANAQLLPTLGYVSVVLANSLDRSSVNFKLLYKNSANNYTQLDREEIPVIFKGAKGDSGTSVDIVFARGSSPPALTGTANPPNASWSTNVASAPGTGILWSSTGYSSDGGTTWAWDTAVQVEGTTGSSGESVAEISAFTRTSTNLSSSSVTGGSYDFNTKTLTVPTGGGVTWYDYIPTGTDPIWETRTTAAVTTPTTVDNVLTWSTPVKVSQNGTAATITLGSVNTGGAGSNVIVTNSGDSTNATLNFTIPRGDTGAAAKGIDILGGTAVSFKRSSDGVYTPTNSGTLTASPQNLVSPTYNWTVSGGSFSSSSTITSSSASSVTVYPTDTSSVIVTLQATAETVVYNKTLYYSVVADGVGTAGKRTATGVVYKAAYTTDDTVPDAPTATSFTFSTSVFTGGTVGDGTWSKAAPTFVANNTYRYWVATFTAVEGNTNTTTGTGGSLTFGTPTKALGFSGLVTFSGSNAVTDGTNTVNGFTNQTQIDGGQITTGSISAGRIDTRNLTIKDSNGNIIFGSGTALDWSNISTSYPSTIDNSSVTATTLGAVKVDLSNAPAGILNSNVTATTLGAVKVDLSNAPAGILNSNITAVTIGAVKIDLTNAPSGILNNNLYISKTGAVYSLQGGGISTSIDAAGLAAVKTDLTNAPSDILNSNVTATSIGAVKTDLSNAPAGILNGQISITEVNGVVTLSNAGTGSFATITSNNKISATNVANFMQEAAIGEAFIGSVNAGKITAGTLDAARIGAGSIDAGKLIIGSAGTGSYMRLFNNKIEVYDSNVLRIKIGYLA